MSSFATVRSNHSPATRVVTVAPDELVDARARLAQRVDEGCEVLEITEPVDTFLDTEHSLHALHLLRDATGFGLSARWVLRSVPEEPSLLVHLLPPAAGVDPETSVAAEQWRDRHRFGLCFYRVGPSFVTIKDVRPGLEAARMTIEADDADTFRALAEHDGGGHPTPLAGSVADAVTGLVDIGLCRAGHAGVLVLPYRIRRWPTGAGQV